jgi:hypothetical protein
MSRILLIYPPVAKPSEPPAGIARLKGFLIRHRIETVCLDVNLEAQLDLLSQDQAAGDRWTQQAISQREEHLRALRNGTAFKTIDHYNRIVRDLNRILQRKETEYITGLADCTHQYLSPVRSQDLINCAEKTEKNPFYCYYTHKLIPQIEKIAPDLIGISLNFLSQAFCTFSLIGLIRRLSNHVQIVLGGGLITSWMQNPAWKNPFQEWVDDCVAGPGEKYFINLYGLKETAESAEPVYTEMTNGYLSPGNVIPYNASSGCWWRRCLFCPECAEDNVYTPIPHFQVDQELDTVIRCTKPDLIHFLDNALDPSFLEHWIHHERKISWYGYVRFTDQLLDLEYCLQLKKSGCVMLKLGLESGDPNVLEKMQKGILLDHIPVILSNLRQAGIMTYIYLLFGTPYESETEARKTMAFIIKNNREITFINAALFNMPVNSSETLHYRTWPISNGDLSLYVNFHHPRQWTRHNVRIFLDREFRRHPAISAILRRTPKIFTSNHAPFFQIPQNS